MTFILRTALAAAAIFSATPVFATPSATARVDLSSVTWTVTDTNPDDGINAAFQMTSGFALAGACLGREGYGPCHPEDIGSAPFFWSDDPVLAWNTPSSAAANFPTMNGFSNASSTALYAEVAGFSPSGRRSVNAEMASVLTFQGAGHLDITVDYALTATANGDS